MVRVLAVMVFVVLSIACKPKTQLPQKDPKTWSASGWQMLRWGMGPGDVELALRQATGELSSLRVESLPDFEKPVASDADRSWIELPGTLSLLGRACDVRLGFYKGELFFVGLSARFPGLDEQGKKPDDSVERFHAKERHAWRDKIVGLLRDKYGAPRKTENTDADWWTAEWAHDKTVVTLSAIDVFLADSGERAVELYYEDPVRSGLAQNGDPADESKL